MKAPRTRLPLTHAASIQRLGRQLSVWRERRRHREPIPEPLWQRAADLARIHGVNPVAAALRLNYYDLQRRSGLTAGPTTASRQPTFVEVAATALTGGVAAGPTLIEWVHPSGSRLTVRLQHTQDLVAVVQTLLRP